MLSGLYTVRCCGTASADAYFWFIKPFDPLNITDTTLEKQNYIIQGNWIQNINGNDWEKLHLPAVFQFGGFVIPEVGISICKCSKKLVDKHRSFMLPSKPITVNAEDLPRNFLSPGNWNRCASRDCSNVICNICIPSLPWGERWVCSFKCLYQCWSELLLFLSSPAKEQCTTLKDRCLWNEGQIWVVGDQKQTGIPTETADSVVYLSLLESANVPVIFRDKLSGAILYDLDHCTSSAVPLPDGQRGLFCEHHELCNLFAGE